MIRIQTTSAGSNRLLVGSDLLDASAAKREVEEWVALNDYCVPRNARHLTIFENGVAVREWVLVERETRAMAMPPQPEQDDEDAFWRNWNRRMRANAHQGHGNVVLLYPTAA